MWLKTTAIAAALAAAAIAAGGCGDDEGTATEAIEATALPQGSEQVALDPAEFTTAIDNEWWPMAVGSRWVYREAEGGGAAARVVVTVTPRTREIANGVEARVVHDVVSVKGEPVEITDDWYAQDARATSGTSARTRPSTRTAGRSRPRARSKRGPAGPRPG